MPEGDTLFRAASVMHRALAGRTVTSFETVLPRLASVDDQSPLKGRTIERVVAAGKNLIIDFSGDLHLHTHMRMNGSWHIYRPGERWQRPRRDMRIILGTDAFVAVAFSVPVAEFHSGSQLARKEDLRRLGPDVLDPAFDRELAIRNIRARGDQEIANVLLNQRVLAGIGNIWKSETLFVSATNPWTRVADLDESRVARIVDTAVKLLRHSATTIEGRPRMWVYERAGDPCRKCATTIRYKRQGPDARGTYWCPRCQAA